jgi:hypothetical protein
VKIPLRTHCVLFICTLVQTISTMKQFIDAVKTSITNGPASTSSHNANCKDGDTKLLDYLRSFLEE